MTSLDEAVLELRADPRRADIVRDAYLDEDWSDAADRYARSGEFAAVLGMAGAVRGAVIVDVGAGRALASSAWVDAGAALVVAIEPDDSGIVGYKSPAASRPESVALVASVGENLPIADGAADVVFCRQVLHHVADLRATLAECARVLKPGGRGVLCREHVADTPEQLAEFLASHPVHQLAGGEHAWPLSAYIAAIEGSGLRLVQSLGPWDSVLNAFPIVENDAQLSGYARLVLGRRFGGMGRAAAVVPGVAWLVRRRLNRPFGGRLYSFIVERPGDRVES